MPQIDKAKAEDIAEDYVRKTMLRMELVEDTSNFNVYGITDLSEYHIFCTYCKMHSIIGSSSYVGVHKQDGSVINFKSGE